MQTDDGRDRGLPEEAEEENGRTYLQVVRSYRRRVREDQECMHVGSLGVPDALAAEHGLGEAAWSGARAEAGRLGAERFLPAGLAKVAVELDPGPRFLPGPRGTELGAFLWPTHTSGDLGWGGSSTTGKPASLAFDAMRR